MLKIGEFLVLLLFWQALARKVVFHKIHFTQQNRDNNRPAPNFSSLPNSITSQLSRRMLATTQAVRWLTAIDHKAIIAMASSSAAPRRGVLELAARKIPPIDMPCAGEEVAAS